MTPGLDMLSEQGWRAVGGFPHPDGFSKTRERDNEGT